MTRHVAIVGPTATGKSRLAMELAMRSMNDPGGGPPFEIVSVDSMCVYRGMDIGTAKPSLDDRRRVTHHMIDLVDPGEEYSLSLFQSDARRCIAKIAATGKRALLVGGTGLYLRAVIDELELPPRWPEIAEELVEEAASGGALNLHRRLQSLDPTSARRMEPTNTRRIVRALEVTLGSGRPFSSFGPGLASYAETDYIVVGVDTDNARLDERIALRVEAQMEAGFLAEVDELFGGGHSPSRTAAAALGYRELMSHLRGERSLAEAVAETVRRTRIFARRQRRWFRRDPRIAWVDADSCAGDAGVPAILERCIR